MLDDVILEKLLNFWYITIGSWSEEVSSDKVHALYNKITNDNSDCWRLPIQSNIINAYSMKFLVQSQTKPNIWYALNLNFKCNKYINWVHICKHILVVYRLLDREFKYLKLVLLSNEMGLLHIVHKKFEVEISIQVKMST